MRKVPVLIVLTAFICAGCGLTDPGIHQVRVKNSYPSHFDYVKIGPDMFYYIPEGTVKEYQPIEEGTHKVTGQSLAGTISGKLTFEGSGRHDWTVIIAPSGYLTLVED